LGKGKFGVSAKEPFLASYSYTPKDGKAKISARCHMGGEDIVAKKQKENRGQ
jgi:hypothetical protein